MNKIKEPREYIYIVLAAMFLVSFGYFYFFFSGLDYNPMYGDDYRSIHLAKTYTWKNLTTFFFQPFSEDIYLRTWVIDRPVYYFFLKGIQALFGEHPYWYYLFRTFTVSILLVLLSYLFYVGTKNLLFTALLPAFVISIPQFMYTSIWIMEIWPLVTLFLIASLILLTRMIDTGKAKYIVLFLITSYITLRTKTDGKMLLPIFIVAYILSWRNTQLKVWKAMLIILLFIVLAIPTKNPFIIPNLSTDFVVKPLWYQTLSILFFQTFEEPYGWEQMPIILTKPFPFSIEGKHLPIPFSIFGSFGPLMGWLIIFSMAYAVIWFVSKKRLFKITTVEKITLVWMGISLFLVALMSTKQHPVHLPRYLAMAALPWVFGAMLLLNKVYVFITKKRIFAIVTVVVIIHLFLTGLAYNYRIRSIEGEVWNVFNDAVRAMYEHQTGKPVCEGMPSLVYSPFFSRNGEFSHLTPFLMMEHYNYVIHAVFTYSNIGDLRKKQASFYYVDFFPYADVPLDQLTTKSNVSLTHIKTFTKCAEGPFCAFKKIVRRLRLVDEEKFADIYLVTFN